MLTFPITTHSARRRIAKCGMRNLRPSCDYQHSGGCLFVCGQWPCGCVDAVTLYALHSYYLWVVCGVRVRQTVGGACEVTGGTENWEVILFLLWLNRSNEHCFRKVSLKCHRFVKIVSKCICNFILLLYCFILYYCLSCIGYVNCIDFTHRCKKRWNKNKKR